MTTCFCYILYIETLLLFFMIYEFCSLKIIHIHTNNNSYISTDALNMHDDVRSSKEKVLTTGLAKKIVRYLYTFGINEKHKQRY